MGGQGFTEIPDRAFGSFAPALQRLAIILTTFSFLLTIMRFLVFFSGNHVLRDRFREIFARRVLVSTAALALVPPHVLRNST